MLPLFWSPPMSVTHQASLNGMAMHFLLLNTFSSEPACWAVLRCHCIPAPRGHSFSKNQWFCILSIRRPLSIELSHSAEDLLSGAHSQLLRGTWYFRELLLVFIYLFTVGPPSHLLAVCRYLMCSMATPLSKIPVFRQLTEVQIGTGPTSVLEDAVLHLWPSPIFPCPAIDPIPYLWPCPAIPKLCQPRSSSLVLLLSSSQTVPWNPSMAWTHRAPQLKFLLFGLGQCWGPCVNKNKLYYKWPHQKHWPEVKYHKYL